MQYSIVGNDIALIMHYHALLKRSDLHYLSQETYRESARGV